MSTASRPRGENIWPPVEPGSDKSASSPKTGTADDISNAERELYGGRLRYDQSYARHERPLTRTKFRHMAAALPRMVSMVLRTGWKADRRVVMGVIAAELGQGVTAGWELVAVNAVLAQLFADGPTVDKLRDAPPSLVSTSRPVPSILMRRSLRLRGCGPWPREGHAVVLVTHRLAATMHADHIYVLDRGSVVEDATHEDLTAIKGGLYQGMFAVQAAQYGIMPAPNGVRRPRGTQPTGHETAS